MLLAKLSGVTGRCHVGLHRAICRRWVGTSSSGIVRVLGAPFAYGQPIAGVELAPNAFREAGIVSHIKCLGLDVEDLGDIQAPTLTEATSVSEYAHNSDVLGAVNEIISDTVATACEGEGMAITIGGDHSIAVGTVSGVLRARPDSVVVWVDAHADINTPRTSPTGAARDGNIHGMPVSFLMQMEDCKGVGGFEWLAKKAPVLRHDRLVYIGLRDLDAGEKEIIRELNIAAFTMADVDRLGIGEVVKQAMQRVNPYMNLPIHLSLDIDSIDPTWAPSTGTAVPGGLTYREVHYICEEMHRTGLLGSMDLVEVNPRLGAGGSIASSEARQEREAELTIQLGLGIVMSSLGKVIL